MPAQAGIHKVLLNAWIPAFAGNAVVQHASS